MGIYNVAIIKRMLQEYLSDEEKGKGRGVSKIIA